MRFNDAFSDQLRNQWKQNFVATILFARTNYQRIPQDLVSTARNSRRLSRRA